ncbi:MAG TPA: hypothetical protein VE645_09710 [Pseudonocardiaceae bacterium]|nr:hypothetical protein [Pseudonocardiaceae bacterium]
MTVDRQLSAALRAQASALGTGSPAGAAPDAPHVTARRTGHTAAGERFGLSGWAVLVLAVLLGMLAGGLAGVISIW